MPFVHKWKYDALLRVGRQMSNVMFNLKQDAKQTDRNRATMEDLQGEWDKLTQTDRKEQQG